MPPNLFQNQNTKIILIMYDSGTKLMRKAHPLSFFLLAISFLKLYKIQYVNTQLFQNLQIGATTPQSLINGSIAPFSATKAYTLWGWFRFNGEATAISNILSLRNKPQATESQSPTIVDSNFPFCPITTEQMKANPSLAQQAGVIDNPNCASVINPSSTNNKNEDLLYINYDLGEIVGTTQNYSLIFLIQSGIDPVTKNSDMKIDGFVNQAFNKNIWTFFAVSCDYSAGQGTLYFQEFGTSTLPSFKTISLTYPDFALLESPQLIIAGVENNPYFQSTSGFIGNIAYIETASFYTTDIKNLWIGYMNLNSYAFKGVILELFFDSYDSNSIKSTGSIQKNFTIEGSNTSMYSLNKNKVGVVFKEGSKIDIPNLDLLVSDIRSIGFFLSFEYSEALPNEFFILRRGTMNVNGYLAISLILTQNNKRKLQLLAKGQTTTVTWQSQKNEFVQNQNYKLFIGISLNMANDIVLTFWDLDAVREITLLKQDFIFDTSPKDLVLIGTQDQAGYNGNFTFYRFNILNSLSAALQGKFIPTSKSTKSSTGIINENCTFKTSFYNVENDCMICKNSIATYERGCVDVCSVGFKNATSDICLKCFKEDCSEIDQTVWQIKLINDQTYRIQPSRKLVGNPLFDNIFSMSLKDSNDTSKINYTFSANNKDQFVDFTLTIKSNLINETMNIIPKKDNGTMFYDINRNPMASALASITIDRICYITPSTDDILKGLSTFVLVLFLLSFVILLLFTIFSFNKIDDLGTLWKFFLHNCIKFQFVALLILVNVYMPCCMKSFMDTIFKILISWNRGLFYSISSSNSNSSEFQAIINSNPVPRSFAEKGFQNYILHNNGVLFILNLIILVIYIFFKIWDCAKKRKSRLMYKIFVLVELTLIIAGYAFTLPQATTFEFLNFRFPIFVPSYFGVSFVISIAYALVFFIFWIYTIVRIGFSESFFLDAMNFNKFYYFFAGYKDSKMSHTYDLWFLLSIFISCSSIGALFDYPVTQMIIIVVCMIMIILFGLILRPWIYLFQLLLEILSHLFLVALVILLLVLSLYDKSGCFTCGDREGIFCYAMVILITAYFSILCLGLIAQTLLMRFWSKKFSTFGRNNAYKMKYVEDIRQSQRSIFDSTVRESRINESDQPLMNDLSKNDHYYRKALYTSKPEFKTLNPTDKELTYDQNDTQFKPNHNDQYNSYQENNHAEQKQRPDNHGLRYCETGLNNNHFDRDLEYSDELVENPTFSYDHRIDNPSNFEIRNQNQVGLTKGYDYQTTSNMKNRNLERELTIKTNGGNNSIDKNNGYIEKQNCNINAIDFEKSTMENFMNQLRQNRNQESDVSITKPNLESQTLVFKDGNQIDSYEDNRAFLKRETKDETQFEATMLQNDDIDEADIQPIILKVLSTNNKSIDLDDNRSDLYQKTRLVSKKKDQFYRTRSQENVNPNRNGKFKSVTENSGHYQANGHDLNPEKFKKINLHYDNSIINDDISLYSNQTKGNKNQIEEVRNSRGDFAGLRPEELFGSEIGEKSFGIESFDSRN
jgi:hypothetical protein